MRGESAGCDGPCGLLVIDDALAVEQDLALRNEVMVQLLAAACVLGERLRIALAEEEKEEEGGEKKDCSLGQLVVSWLTW